MSAASVWHLHNYAARIGNEPLEPPTHAGSGSADPLLPQHSGQEEVALLPVSLREGTSLTERASVIVAIEFSIVTAGSIKFWSVPNQTPDNWTGGAA